MNYDRHILDILLSVGERGIKMQTLAKHVYNRSCSLFEQPDTQEVYRYVQQYLIRNSRSAHSLVERTGRWGYYRLNTQGSADARQLMLDFRDESEEVNVMEKTQQDLSLNLFADF